jgi:hypothetical protein
MISLSDREVERVRDVVGAPGPARDLWLRLAARAERHTTRSGVDDPADTIDWWHSVWERLSDVAFAQRMTPTPERAEWLRSQTVAICERPLDDWIGPFFRQRSNPPAGMLETAHVGLAVATAVGLCPDLFSSAERRSIEAALRKNCQMPTRRALDRRLEAFAAGKDDPGVAPLNNWFMVLLNGFGAVSVLLDDADAIAEAVDRYQVAASLFGPDSYGESLQYWNYATLHLSHLWEVLVAHDSTLAATLDHSGYSRCISWVVQSLLYVKPLAGWGPERYPRSLNFGDSAAIFRPTADVALHVANRAADTHPTEAGLARWLFDTTFADEPAHPVDGDTFGFFNRFRFDSLLLLPGAVGPISPGQANLPLTQGFDCGTSVVRDSWAEPLTILGVQGGHGELSVTSHRHADLNSFILSHRQERFFADPGHCCYRLRAQRESASTTAHSTWTFDADGQALGQTSKADRSRIGRTALVARDGDVSVVRSDVADAYGSKVRIAERTWISVLPGVLFVVDRIELAEPMSLSAHFVLNNRDGNLRTHIASDTKLVFRRFAAAMKFFQLSRSADGQDVSDELQRSWGFMHDVYHPRPNQLGQSREGASEIYTFRGGPAQRHDAMYGIAMDREAHIRKWHFRADAAGVFSVDRGAESICRISVDPDGSVTVDDHRDGSSRVLTDCLTRSR